MAGAGRGRWPHVRALLVTIHVTAMFISAIPSPEGGMDRKNWKDPTVQEELSAWASRFGMEEPAFEERLWTAAVAYQRGLDVLLGPVRRYERAVGSTQSWKMFIAAHRFPARMQLQVRGPTEAWETVFEERSATARWHAEAFDQERLRSSIFRWSWPGYKKHWKRACETFADALFAERAAVTEVRCRFHKARSPSPDEARRGEQAEGTWTAERIVARTPPTPPTPAAP